MAEEKDDPDLKERVAKLEADMSWIKKILDKVDKRTWWILGSVILGIIISVIARVI
jgi:hypothetical protein